MSKFVKYTFSGVLLGGLGYLIYKNIDIEQELRDIRNNLSAKRKRWEINNKTNELLINAFAEMILENENISLDEAILNFENAEAGNTLENFAKSKMRNADSYRNSYEPYFNEAKNIVSPKLKNKLII